MPASKRREGLHIVKKNSNEKVAAPLLSKGNTWLERVRSRSRTTAICKCVKKAHLEFFTKEVGL